MFLTSSLFTTTGIIILAPNFRVTSEAVPNPSLLVKAMKKGVLLDGSIKIINQSGKNLSLFWINPDGGSQIPMSDAPLKSQTDPHFFSASIYHQFAIHEECKQAEDCVMQLSPEQGEECTPRMECQIRYFRVTAKEVGK